MLERALPARYTGGSGLASKRRTDHSAVITTRTGTLGPSRGTNEAVASLLRRGRGRARRVAGRPGDLDASSTRGASAIETG